MPDLKTDKYSNTFNCLDFKCCKWALPSRLNLGFGLGNIANKKCAKFGNMSQRGGGVPPPLALQNILAPHSKGFYNIMYRVTCGVNTVFPLMGHNAEGELPGRDHTVRHLVGV